MALRSLASILISALLLTLAASAASAQTVQDGVYRIIPDRSAVNMTIAGAVGRISAELPLADGEIVVRGGQIVSADAVLDTAAVAAGGAMVQRQIKGRSGLDVERHPRGRFVTTRSKLGDGTMTLTGNLTLKGVTHPVSLKGEVMRANPRRFAAALEGEVDRTLFGITAGRPLYGRNAKVQLRLVARLAR